MKKLLVVAAAVSMAFASRAQVTKLEDGIKLYNYENYASAQKALAPLAVNDAIANYYLGLCYLKQGDVKKASYYFQKHPEDPANIAGMIRVAYAQGEKDKAIALAKDLASKAKKKEYMPLVYAAEALTYSDGADQQQAIQWYNDALTKNKEDLEVRLGLGDTYVKTGGGGGEAMNNYEAIVEKQPTNSLVLSRIGDLWYLARNYTSSLEYYEKAINADAKNPLPYKALAYVYMRSAKYEKALEYINKYLPLSDNSVADQITKAEILYLCNKFCDAATQAKEIMNGPIPNEKKATIYGILGYSQGSCGDSVEAIKNVRMYLQLSDKKKITPSDYINYGKLWLKTDNIDSASYYLNLGLASDTSKNKTDIYRQIGDAYKAKKQYCDAGTWYNNLIKSNPETQALDYFWCTVMFYYCKDWKQALEAAEKFEAKYGDQPSATYWHARVLSNIDSEATTGAAVPFFTKWLEKLEPDADKKDKKADAKKAYEYLMVYNFNAKDNEKMQLYMDKLKAIAPDDDYLKQIESMQKSGGSAPKKEPAKGGTPPPKKK